MDYQDPAGLPPRKRRAREGFSLRHLNRISLSWHTLLVICCAILLMGWVWSTRYDSGIARLHVLIDEASDLTYEKEREILRLTEQVRLAETDQFIATEARTKYGYLFPGEIRFVVTNPEVLGLPPRPAESP